MARLFVGIQLPEDCHTRCATLIRELRGRLRSDIRWTPRGNAHITLRFLGETDEARVSDICRQLGDIHRAPFHIRIGSCGFFPDRNHPRVLYAGVTKGASPCADLADCVTEVLGASTAGNRYTPVTLGRIKRLARDDWDGLSRDITFSWPGFKVDRFILWRSTLTTEGPIYDPLSEFPLTAL